MERISSGIYGERGGLDRDEYSAGALTVEAVLNPKLAREQRSIALLVAATLRSNDLPHAWRNGRDLDAGLCNEILPSPHAHHHSASSSSSSRCCSTKSRVPAGSLLPSDRARSTTARYVF